MACSYPVCISYLLELESTAPKRQAPRVNANQLDGSEVYLIGSRVAISLVRRSTRSDGYENALSIRETMLPMLNDA